MNLLLFNLKTDAHDDVLGFTTDWINALAGYFEHVDVITMWAGSLELAPNVSVFSIGHEKGYSKPRRLIEFYIILCRVLRGKKIDVCFAHMMPLFAVMSAPLLRFNRIPIILWYAHKSVTPLLHVAEKLVDKVVSSSRSGFRIKSPKLNVIGQGIDTSRFSPGEKRGATEPLTLLAVGRVSAIKRLDVLIRGVALALQERPELRLHTHIIGAPLTDADAAHALELKRLATDLGVNELISFKGSLPFKEVHRAYQEADLLINTSDTGSVDKVVLEAMSCCVPIITSNIAFEEALGADLASTWMIPPDDPKALTSKLLQFADLTIDERRILGQAFRTIVCDHHSLDALCQKIYRQVASLV